MTHTDKKKKKKEKKKKKNNKISHFKSKVLCTYCFVRITNFLKGQTNRPGNFPNVLKPLVTDSSALPLTRKRFISSTLLLLGAIMLMQTHGLQTNSDTGKPLGQNEALTVFIALLILMSHVAKHSDLFGVDQRHFLKSLH